MGYNLGMSDTPATGHYTKETNLRRWLTVHGIDVEPLLDVNGTGRPDEVGVREVDAAMRLQISDPTARICWAPPPLPDPDACFQAARTPASSVGLRPDPP